MKNSKKSTRERNPRISIVVLIIEESRKSNNTTRLNPLLLSLSLCSPSPSSPPIAGERHRRRRRSPSPEMPPKNQASKADLAKKQKVVEDKTFGLKNKNKSKNVQKYVQSLQQSVQPKPDPSKAAAKVLLPLPWLPSFGPSPLWIAPNDGPPHPKPSCCRRRRRRRRPGTRS